MSGRMRFRVLGGLDWTLDGVALDIGRRRERLLLGLLLLDLGRPVPVSRLIEWLWHENPPDGARGSLQVHISRLRGRFSRADAGTFGFRIVTRDETYVLEGDPEAVDVHRFRARLHRAQQAREPAECSQILDGALAQWSGALFEGIALDGPLRRLSADLDEVYLAAVVLRTQAELALGRHSGLLEGLARLTATWPHHEDLAALRMIALYRSNRRDGALRVFDETRTCLAAGLGLDPGADLRRVHQMVLRDDPALLDPCAFPVPARWGPAAAAESVPGTTQARPPVHLPPVTGDFIGRVEELSRLTKLAEGGCRVIAIVGAAGDGKTALAGRWARQVATRFPDGLLFVDLRGHSRQTPLSQVEALTALLRGLGVAPQDMPRGAAESAARYQQLLAGRRLLVVMDNAASATQVRPLLPEASDCLALVTSRNRLGGLVVTSGAAIVTLGRLPHGDAEALVGAIIGADRAAGEPHAVSELVDICDRSPLALRIAAANLVLHPRCRIADHSAALRTGNPLDGLAVVGDRDSAVRSAFELSYRRLEPQAARLFRLLGLLPGPVTTVPAVAALAGIPLAEAEALLEKLFAENLMDSLGPGRFRIHDLIWQYARLLAAAEEPEAVRAAATSGLLRWNLGTADAAARQLYPQILRLGPLPDCVPAPLHFADQDAATAWLDAEHADLVTLIQASARLTTAEPAVWLLADALRGYFWLRRDVESWLISARSALHAAERAEDLCGQAAGHQSLALAYYTVGRGEQSVEHFERALVLARSAGWQECEYATLSNLAGTYADMGDLRRAMDHYTQAIKLYPRLGREISPAQALYGLGMVFYCMGRLAEAEAQYRRALVLCEAIAATDSVARTRVALARVCRDLGRLPEAWDLAEAACRGYRAVGNLAGESEALTGLSLIACDQGKPGEALCGARTALALGRDAGRPRMELDALNALGHIHLRLGHHSDAAECFSSAQRIAGEIGYRRGTVVALIGRGAAAARCGDADRALRYAEQARELAVDSGFSLLEGHAHAVTEAARLDRGEFEAAADARQRVTDIYARTGYHDARAVRKPEFRRVWVQPPPVGSRWGFVRKMTKQLDPPATSQRSTNAADRL